MAWRALVLAVFGCLVIAAGPRAIARQAREDPPRTAHATRDPLPLGTFTSLPKVPTDCPSLFSCQSFSVSGCPSVVQVAAGEIAIGDATTGAPTGMTAFFSGNTGAKWWGAVGSPDDFFQSLRDAGITVVLVRWVTPWLLSSPGVATGPSVLACRPATAIRWIHDQLYVPLGITPAPLQCGFCLSGSSGGASQVSYALSFYGLDAIVDAVVPTSGPDHAALSKGCLRDNASRRYWFNQAVSQFMDDSLGYQLTPGQGPCALHDVTFGSQWDAMSVDTGANLLLYPTTRVVFIFGGLDCGPPPAHGNDYYDPLMAAGSPFVERYVINGMGHQVSEYPTGLEALTQALLGQPVTNTAPPCYPLP